QRERSRPHQAIGPPSRQARKILLDLHIARSSYNPMLVGALTRSVRVIRCCCVCSKRMRDGPKSNAVPSRLLIPIWGLHPDNESAGPERRAGAFWPAPQAQHPPPRGAPNRSGANGRQQGRSARTGGMAVNVDLAGRVAVVSGASAGLGRAIAQGLAAAGADVVIGSRNADAIKRAASEIAGSTGRQVVGVPADVSRADAANALLDAAMTRFGKINVLVANAGGPPPGSALTLTDADWEQAFRQNLMSAVWLIRGAVPSMKAQGGGRILTVITSGVKVPIP